MEMRMRTFCVLLRFMTCASLGLSECARRRRKDMRVVLVPVYLLLITPVWTTFAWWSNSSQIAHDPATSHLCRRHPKGKRSRDGRRLRDLCADTKLLAHIHRGLHLAHEECAHQFRHRRWNCTIAKQSMKKVLQRDTRETGFVNAITAAGVAYAVTRACTTGELSKCACDARTRRLRRKDQERGVQPQHMPDGDWHWGGCGENVHYGVRTSKDFLDTRPKRLSDLKTMVKLHNYAAGRMALKKYMRPQCKCHGLSGSCTVRTCWKKMPPFRDVGDRIKEHFDGAAKVVAGNDGSSFIPEGDTIKPPNREDLVYFEESSKFCEEDAAVGSLGTQGRRCNASSLGEEGCDILCCGRGYRTEMRNERVHCRCQFQWCCWVECVMCASNIEANICL